MSDPVLRDFPDVERLLAGLYEPLLGGANHVGSETPDDLELRLPFLRLTRVSGPRTVLMDFPTVEWDYFDADELTGKPAASQLLNLLLRKPPPHPAIDLVTCPLGPRELPWSNEAVRRWGATLDLQLRQVRVVA